MIGLSAPTYDPMGTVVLDTRVTNPYDTTRRGSVTATLDGGVSVYDSGWSVADQILRATVTRPSRETLVALRYLIAYYVQLVACCETGCYLGVPSMTVTGKQLNFNLRVTAKLDG